MVRIPTKSTADLDDHKLPPGEFLLTPQEVARALRVTPAWVRKAVLDGRLSGIKVGDATRIHRSAVVDLIEGNAKKPKTK